MTFMFRNRKYKFFHGRRVSPDRPKPSVPTQEHAEYPEAISKINFHTSGNKMCETHPPLSSYISHDRVVHEQSSAQFASDDVETNIRSVQDIPSQSEHTILYQNKYDEFLDHLQEFRPAKRPTKAATNKVPLYPFVAAPSYPSSSQALLYIDTKQIYDSWRNCIYTEKQRRGMEISKDGQRKQPFLLPWWTIFIGYAIIIASISASAAFTFFYSLQWGGAVSLDWMASLFFSTTTGAFLIEPVKVS